MRQATVLHQITCMPIAIVVEKGGGWILLSLPDVCLLCVFGLHYLTKPLRLPNLRHAAGLYFASTQDWLSTS